MWVALILTPAQADWLASQWWMINSNTRWLHVGVSILCSCQLAVCWQHTLTLNMLTRGACCGLLLLCSMPWLALKALPSGYTATSPWSVNDKEKPDATTAMAVSSGVYSYYQVRLSCCLSCAKVCVWMQPLQCTPWYYSTLAGAVLITCHWQQLHSAAHDANVLCLVRPVGVTRRRLKHLPSDSKSPHPAATTSTLWRTA